MVGKIRDGKDSFFNRFSSPHPSFNMKVLFKIFFYINMPLFTFFSVSSSMRNLRMKKGSNDETGCVLLQLEKE